LSVRDAVFDLDRYPLKDLNAAHSALLHFALDMAEHDRLDSDTPKLAELKAWDQLLRMARDWMRVAAVDAAKHHTWAEIGGVLGVTPQAAHKRFAARGEVDG
jgi:hypothetical protein